LRSVRIPATTASARMAAGDLSIGYPRGVADAPTSLIGEVLQDTYRIERRLGGGGMGVVYEAVHVRLPDKRYAIKVLTLAPGAHLEETELSRRELFQRLGREAEIASRVGHPHIVEGHDFHTLPGGEPYLVMEHLDGEDLAARIRRAGPLPIRSVRRIASEVASALEAAHQARVI